MFLDREIMTNGIAEKLGVDKGEMRRETLEILRDLGIDTKSCDATKPVIPEERTCIGGHSGEPGCTRPLSNAPYGGDRPGS